MDLQELKALVPKTTVKQLEKNRPAELRQSLQDLGYLLRTHPSGLASAIGQFRADYHALGFLPDFEPQIDQLDTSQLDGLELSLLQRFTALDGDFSFTEMPNKGESNLLSRILHYRLEVFGLYKRAISAPMGNSAIKCIQQVQSWLTLPDSALETVNLLGDLPALIQQLNDSKLLSKQVVCFAYKKPNLPDDLSSELKEEEGEKDSGEEGQKEESKLDQQMFRNNEQLLGKEQAAIQRIELRNKSRARREERITTMMQKILDEQEELLQANLKAQQQIRNSIQDLENQRTTALKKRQDLKEGIKIKEQRIKAIQKQQGTTPKVSAMQKEIKSIQSDIKSPKNLAQLLAEAAQLEIEGKQIKQQLANNRRGASARRARRAARRHEKALKINQREISARKRIQQLLDQLKNRQPTDQQLALLIQEQQELRLTIRQLSTKLSDNKKDIAGLQKQLEALINDGQTSQGIRQKKLKQMQKRLQKIRSKLNGLKFRFKAQLKRSLAPSYYRQLKSQVFQRRNAQQLKSMAATPLNKFLLQLLQVHQWTNGYYNGQLDSRFGQHTFGAITQFTEDISRLKLKYILTKLGGASEGFWLLNAAYLFEQLGAVYQRDKKKNVGSLVISNYQAAFGGEEPQLQSEMMDEALDSLHSDVEEGRPSVGFGRRIYYGVRGLARSLLRGLGKLVILIKNKIKKMLNLLKNFVQFLYKEIREGIVKYGVGLAILIAGGKLLPLNGETGKRILDTLGIQPGKLIDRFIMKAAKGNQKKARHIQFCITLVGKVLKWGLALATGGLTWPQLALRVALSFRDMARKWLRSRLGNVRKKIAMT